MNSLALMVITKNAAATIEKCLSSAKPYVDKMIVIDHGSTDQTRELSQMAGAEFYSLPTFNDPVIDKNLALSVVSADWIFFLEQDETLINSGKIEDIRGQLSRDHDLGFICIHQESTAAGETAFHQRWAPRIIKSSVRFEKSDFEYPPHIGSEVFLPISVRKMASGTHAYPINLLRWAESAFKENPKSAFLHFKIGVEAEIREEWTSASKYFTDAIELGGLDSYFGLELAVRSMNAMSQSGSIDRAMEIARKAVHKWPQLADVQFA